MSPWSFPTSLLLRIACLLLAASLPIPAHAILDRNHNGMSDIWEQLHNIAPQDTTLDPDHDGWTNLQESLLGTNPHIFHSGLTTDLILTPNDARLRVDTILGKRYQAWQSMGNIGQPSSNPWTPLGPVFTGNGSPIDIVLSLPAGFQGPIRFRVSLVSELDADNDSLSAWEEFMLGTSDSLQDTDGDALSDFWEAFHGTNPNNPDTDGDGVPEREDARPNDPATGRLSIVITTPTDNSTLP